MQFIINWLKSRRWSIRTKLLSGLVFICLFLALLILFSILIIDELGNKINVVAQTQEGINRTNSLVDATERLESTLNLLNEDMSAINLISTDLLNGKLNAVDANARYQTYIVELQKQRRSIDSEVKKLKELAILVPVSIMPNLDPNGFMQTVEDDFAELLSETDQIWADTLARQSQKAVEGWKETGPHLSQNIAKIAQFQQNISNAAEQATTANQRNVKETTSSGNNAQLVLGIVGMLIILLAILFGLTLTHNFTGPLERLRSRLMKLAEGDLTTALEVASRDQFGELATTFNQSVGRLGSVVGEFQNQALKVSSAAAQIAAASRQSALISADQAGAVAEATVTIEELSHTAQQIAEAASLVANAAEQALSSASDGQETVRTSIMGINGLKIQVQDIAGKILALSERSQRVGHIIEQITSIADQTHLLALNAAIESVAAGENGKRFAVVAAEVKKLSERSRNATKEVQAVLSEIQAATNASVMATEQGMKEAERGVALAHKSGDANESIIQMVERTVQLANAISLATQQQRSASEQVVASMRQLATVIQDGAASAKQSSSLAISLDEIASELRRLSSQFKVEKSNLATGNDNSGTDGEVLYENESLALITPLFRSAIEEKLTGA
ncbi:MAG: HAMP domain-containing protein [Chloroflexi bacterium]|nr:HAMP domain-containing protein [Chloroflexota bacterium]